MERINICKGKPDAKLLNLLKKAGFDLKTLQKSHYFFSNSSIEVPEHFRIEKKQAEEMLIKGYYNGWQFKLSYRKDRYCYFFTDETFEQAEQALQKQPQSKIPLMCSA